MLDMMKMFIKVEMICLTFETLQLPVRGRRKPVRCSNPFKYTLHHASDDRVIQQGSFSMGHPFWGKSNLMRMYGSFEGLSGHHSAAFGLVITLTQRYM